jgi:hypothetical protein
MTILGFRSGIAVRAIAAALLAGCGSGRAFAQRNGSAPVSTEIPRTPGGKPDFSGFFNIPYVPNMAAGPRASGAGTTGDVDRVASGESAVPYTEAGKAAYLNHDSKDDPTANCWLPGVPRIMQSPFPAQFVQNSKYLVILFEYMRTFRSIPLDGRPHPPNMEPAFMGDSTGHWEGDELVVDTVNMRGAPWTWLDTAGHQHSDALHVVERFRRMADHIEYQYTVDDPKLYAKPWTLKRNLTPLPTAAGLPELLEYSCSENNKDVEHLVPTKPALETK